MSYEKPDGTIHYGLSGCCCPPGDKRRHGLHTNSSTSWFRINNGAWHRIPDMNEFRLIAGAAETCAEFADYYDNQYKWTGGI